MFETRKDPDRRVGASVTRALAGHMFREAAFDVGGDACVQAATAAFEQIDVPLGHVASVAMAAVRFALRCESDVIQFGNTLPGLSMQSGSNACFTARIAANVGASKASAM